MIFNKHILKLQFEKQDCWATKIDNSIKIVNDRKYFLANRQNHITIERKINDVWDLVGFVPFKRIGLAKGEIKAKNNGLSLELHIQLSKVIEYLFIASILVFSCLIVLVMLKELMVGIMLFLGLVATAVMQYYIFNIGLNGFYSDLETDINYFHL